MSRTQADFANALLVRNRQQHAQSRLYSILLSTVVEDAWLSKSVTVVPIAKSGKKQFLAYLPLLHLLALAAVAVALVVAVLVAAAVVVAAVVVAAASAAAVVVAAVLVEVGNHLAIVTISQRLRRSVSRTQSHPLCNARNTSFFPCALCLVPSALCLVFLESYL